jgi:hypothetical protein|tara:strand:+ start:294 stop:416 length:123 start_codon:yes stop_codon:yes gene_type:complete
MALTQLRGNIITAGTVTQTQFAAPKPASTGKAIAMAMVFG